MAQKALFGKEIVRQAMRRRGGTATIAELVAVMQRRGKSKKAAKEFVSRKIHAMRKWQELQPTGIPHTYRLVN